MELSAVGFSFSGILVSVRVFSVSFFDMKLMSRGVQCFICFFLDFHMLCCLNLPLHLMRSVFSSSPDFEPDCKCFGSKTQLCLF